MAGAPSLEYIKAIAPTDGKLIVVGFDIMTFSNVGAIYNLSPAPSTKLTLTYPNGSEKLSAGSMTEITWTSEGEVGPVNIEYSIDNGTSWTEIIAGTENDGSYPWIVPCDLSPSSLVKISEADGEASDVSDGVFSIVDDVAPEIEISLSSDQLWPPNHKLVPMSAMVAANDNCDPAPDIKLESITVNEEENNHGDGNTLNDIQGANFGTADYHFFLRAERSGKGTGRIYTVTYTTADSSGNTTAVSAMVIVPHNHKK
jgi:hypothetical protein